MHRTLDLIGLERRSRCHIQLDINKLIEYYKTFGFFDVKIHYEKRWNPGYDSIDIVIVIDEGIPCIWIYIGDTVCVFCVFDVIAGLCL